MLEIYITKQSLSNGKTINQLEKIDDIRDDSWIHAYAPTEEELKRLENEIGAPPEFLRYPLDEEERPRIDLDDNSGAVLILIDIPYARKEGTFIHYETSPLGIIITHKHILTISLRDCTLVDPFTNGRVKDLVVHFRTRFTIQILLSGAKDYLKLLRYIDKTLDASERELSKSISNKDLYKHLELGKSLIYFSTSLKSNDVVLEKLMRGRIIKQYEEDEDLLEDVIIEFKQAREMADIYASIINGNMDAYASIINNNMNVIMKIMAAATICLSVPNTITSFFGQNAPMPWDSEFFANPWPFCVLLLSSLASIFMAAYILKKKRMF